MKLSLEDGSRSYKGIWTGQRSGQEKGQWKRMRGDWRLFTFVGRKDRGNFISLQVPFKTHFGVRVTQVSQDGMPFHWPFPVMECYCVQ